MKILRFFFLIAIFPFFISACSQSQVPLQQQRQSAPAYSSQQQQRPQQRQQPRPQYSSAPRVSRINPARSRVVNIAKSTLGTPYKWGGNTRRGFDCSGLTKYVHKQALGINIPRTTAKQRDSSRTINYAQLQPGDMLFFKTGRNSNHVGVYIGNRQFVHAPSSGKRVSVASMDSPYWYRRFVKFGTYF